MPRQPDPDPSPAALRKRRERERKKEQKGVVKYNEDAAAAAKAYRAKKKSELEEELRQADDPEAEVGFISARAALEKARREAVKEMSKGLQELYSAKIKTAEEAEKMAPALIAKAKEMSEKKALQV